MYKNWLVRRADTKGFTLLEVVLFLSISAGLIAIATIGLAPRLTNVRFSTAVRGFESSLYTNLNKMTTGQNNRAGLSQCTPNLANGQITFVGGGSVAAGSAHNCVANGAIAVMDQPNNQVIFRQVISLRQPYNGAACAYTGFNKIIQCHGATLLSDTNAPQNVRYSYLNGLTQTAPSGEVGFGYLQDPNGTTIYPFQATSPTNHFAGGALKTILTISANPNDTMNVCYALNSRQARFTFSNQSLKPAVNINEGCS